MKNKTTIIAEIGENHLGDWDMARRMIEEAAKAGADIVKFQSYLGSEVAPADPERDWFTRVQVPDEMHVQLQAEARKNGVEFLSAPFSLGRAKLLCERLGLKAIKVASSEMLNFRLLDYVNGRVDTVYLSTGMATIEEIRKAVARLKDVPQIAVLHCVTQYPLKPEDANLRAISLIAEEFPEVVPGYSDHTIGIVAPVVAVALGARVIEKHFTLAKELPGTDHVLSATPAEFRRMVDQIREAEALLGRRAKEPVATERAIIDFVRSRFPK